MVDYSERRPVNTNRPRKQGMARYFVLTAVGGLLAGVGLGLAGGWFMFKPSRQELNALRVAAEKSAAPAPAPASPPQPAPTAGPPDPNLSFYKTLPGGKPVLGTGMNPAKPEDPAPVPAAASIRPDAAPAAPAAPQQPAAKPPAPPAPAAAKTAAAPAPPDHRASPPPEKTAVKPPPLTAVPAPAPLPSGADQARKAQAKGKYVVQVASYQSRSDADALKERLIDAGLPAYVVEGVLKEKGTMYRVRVGRHLELSAAEELAARSGKNAIPILE